MTPRLKELVSRRATDAEMRTAATDAGTRSLLRNAIHKLRQGLTTAEEILRVIRIEQADDARPPNRLALLEGTQH
jgi:type II secretory ATPase GspE/PulE/Tfp pilus assembly ATPase PilB-like protein